MASRQDLTEHTELIGLLKDRCGRLVLNGVPTGVEVCLSMQHGGPFPATTDARFGAVGADAIKRFARPFAWQNWEHEFLPDELKDQNPCGIWRTVNEKLDRS
jgi:NADP-dependent aldehyde dehydrogenase